MSQQLKYPWRLDTNDRYRELVTTMISLSTASLLLPVFFARDYLGIDENLALKSVLPCTTYIAWISLCLSILSGIVFHYFSAKWARLAWEQPVSLCGKNISESFVEKSLECSLWACIALFILGIISTLLFIVNFTPKIHGG